MVAGSDDYSSGSFGLPDYFCRIFSFGAFHLHNFLMKSFFVNLGLAFASIIIMLVVLEVLVRIFFPGAHRHQWAMMMDYHPQAGYLMKKNLDTDIDTGNGSIHVITNDYGYIGESFPAEKPEGEYRIFNFGDSYVEGMQMVDWDKTFVNLLGSETGSLSANFGLGGRGTVEEFYAYKYIAKDLHPDLNILWFTEANDFANNYLPVTDYASLAENKMGTVKYWLKKSALVSFVFEHLKSNLTFISLLQKLGLSNTTTYTGNEEISVEVPFDNQVNYSLRPELAEIQEHAHQVTEELIVSFKELSLASDEKFLVVIIPGTLYLYPSLQEEFFEFYDTSSSDYDFSLSMNTIKDILERNGIEYIDLTDFIREYEVEKSCGELFVDHFSPCGHQKVAEYVGKYILERVK